MADIDNNAFDIDPWDFDGGNNNQDPAPAEPVADPSQNANNNAGDDIVPDLLAANGISDSSKIKFEDEQGNIIERNWNDLTKEERIAILSPQQVVEHDDNGLSQDEIDLINTIRNSQQTPASYLQALRDNAAQDAQVQSYEIDGITDDELFILDAIDKYGEENITDEQLESLLKNAKSDPELYAKSIATMREQYKKREDDLKYQRQQEDEARSEQDFEAFSESILNEIQSLKKIAGQDIELSTDDMNELANYMLTRDEDGNSEFGKAMNDPRLFTQMAFWALKGNDIMNEISGQIKVAYEKGLEAGKRGQSQLVFGNKPDHSAQKAQGTSAFDLDIE